MNQTPQLAHQDGDLIAGRYLVHHALAGGMGEVYLCTDQQTQARYALKTFRAPHWRHAGLGDAFEAEAGVWVALETHVNVVRCFFMDSLEGRPYMFLEWVDAGDRQGSDLRGLLQRGPLPPRQALELAMDVCHGLKHAQDRQPGLVHRDLKPENVLIAQGMQAMAIMTAGGIKTLVDEAQPRFHAKITDFGLAKIAHDLGLQIQPDPGGLHQSMHADAGIVGTPRYMAPEQWQGEPVDARADIYAIGAMLYEMLSGQPPFTGTTLQALREQHLNGPVPAPVGFDLPESLGVLVSRCLAKDRAARFSTVVELQQALKQVYLAHFGGYKPADYVMPTPFMPEDMVNRAKTYHELGRHDEALADLDAAIRAYPHFAPAFELRGVVREQRGDLARALDDLDHAIRLDPARAGAHTNRGALHSRMGRNQEALADHARAIELDPMFATAWANRGALHRWLGQDEAALSDLDRAIELDPSIGFAHHERALLHLRHGRLQAALRDLSHAIECMPDAASPRVARSHVLKQLGRLDEALDDCDAALRIDADSAQAYFNRGAIQQRRGRFLDALADYRRVLELAPDRADALVNRGAILNEIGRREEAHADLTRALALDPSSALAWMNRGVVNDGLDRDHEAIADFDRAIALSPDLAEAWINRAHRHARAERSSDALADLDHAIGLNPASEAALVLRGRLLAGLQRHSDAITDFTQAIHLIAASDTFDRRGRSHAALGQHAEAIADYSQALAAGCDDAAMVLTSRGVASLRAGDAQGALDDFVAAIQTNPRLVAARVLAADLLVAHGQAEDAVPLYVEAVRSGEVPWAERSAAALRRLGVAPAA